MLFTVDKSFRTLNGRGYVHSSLVKNLLPQDYGTKPSFLISLHELQILIKPLLNVEYHSEDFIYAQMRPTRKLDFVGSAATSSIVISFDISIDHCGLVRRKQIFFNQYLPQLHLKELEINFSNKIIFFHWHIMLSGEGYHRSETA